MHKLFQLGTRKLRPQLKPLSTTVVHYGLPKRIHSDQAANFESNLIKELCAITGMQKSRTSPYHPSGNGMCERFNRTLLNMLGTLDPNKKSDWKSHVSSLVHAYNCTRHESTGHSPLFLMFGREPRLPIDIAFELNQPLSKYVSSLRDRLAKSYELASKASRAAQDRQKKGYDIRVRGADLQPGDRVLVRILAFEGKHKISDRWEEDAYVVLEQPNTDIPVFVVRKENGDGRKKTLHRNLLLPIGALPPQEPAPTPVPRESKPIPKPRRRRIYESVSDSHTIEHSDGASEQSDDFDVLLTSQGGTETGIPADARTDLGPVVPVPQQLDDDQETESTGSVDLCGDAHPSTEEEEGSDSPSSDGEEVGDEDENPDAIHSASEGTEDVSVDTAPDTVTGADEVPHPEIPLRRSHRARSQPSWMTSGEYAMSLSTAAPLPDWRDRVACLQSLISSGLTGGERQQAVGAIMPLVTGNTK